MARDVLAICCGLLGLSNLWLLVKNIRERRYLDNMIHSLLHAGHAKRKAAEIRLMEKYWGTNASDKRRYYNDYFLGQPDRTALAHVLFKLHNHIGDVKDWDQNQIVYREEDIIEMLETLGYTVKF